MKNTINKNKFLALALFSTLIAVGIHAYLSQHYYALKFGAVEGPAFCNINEVLNCDAVTASKYSSFLNIPIALWGVVTNLVLLYLLAITRLNLVQDRAQTSRYSLLFSGGTLLASIVMGSISLTMRNLCIFCIATYALSFLGFIGSFMGAENVNLKAIKKDLWEIFGSQKWILGFLAFIPLAAFTANTMYLDSQGYSQIEKLTEEKIAYWQIAPAQNFDQAAGLILHKGPAVPKMTIVEFADFRCPHCKHAAPSLHAFISSHHDVKLIFKPFPLDGTCNEVMQHGGDGISCGLASAVICAEKMNSKGWAAHDFLFEHQEDVIRSQNLDKNIQELSQNLNMKADALSECIKSAETTQQIKAMAKEGATAQIQGTPAIFVNGKLLNGGQLIPVLEAAYKTLR